MEDARSKIQVGINGVGRVGRCLPKSLLKSARFQVVGLDDMTDLGDLAYLLRYDSVHGWYPPKVEHRKAVLDVGGTTILFLSIGKPLRLPWSELGRTSSASAPAPSGPAKKLPTALVLPEPAGRVDGLAARMAT